MYLKLLINIALLLTAFQAIAMDLSMDQDLFEQACPEVTLYTYPNSEVTLYKGKVGFAKIPAEAGNRIKLVAGQNGVELSTPSGISVGALDWRYLNHLKLKKLSYSTECACSKADTDLKYDLFGIGGGTLDLLGTSVFDMFLSEKFVPGKFQQKGYNICADKDATKVLKDLLDSYGKFLNCSTAPDQICSKLQDSQITIALRLKKEVRDTYPFEGKEVIFKAKKGSTVFVDIKTKGPLESPKMDMIEIYPATYTDMTLNEVGEEDSMMRTVQVERISIHPDGRVEVKVKISAEKAFANGVKFFYTIFDRGQVKEIKDPVLEDERAKYSKAIAASVQQMTQKVLTDYSGTIDEALKAHLPNFSTQNFWGKKN